MRSESVQIQLPNPKKENLAANDNEVGPEVPEEEAEAGESGPGNEFQAPVAEMTPKDTLDVSWSELTDSVPGQIEASTADEVALVQEAEAGLRSAYTLNVPREAAKAPERMVGILELPLSPKDLRWVASLYGAEKRLSKSGLEGLKADMAKLANERRERSFGQKLSGLFREFDRTDQIKRVEGAIDDALLVLRKP